MITTMCKPLLFCLCFLACRKSTNTAANPANPVIIELSRCINVQRISGKMAVCVDSVNDSRCPFNASCVWAGVAVAKFTVTANGHVYSFKLSTVTTPAFAPNDTTVAGHHFQLSNVQPYPGTGSNAVPSVKLVVD